MAKAYEKYKPTGLPWLKTTPRHWDLLRNKAFFSENKIIVGKNHGNYQLLSLTKRGVIVRDMTAGGKFPTEFDSYKTVVPGQIIFCLFDVDETPRTVGLSQNHGMITGSYDVFSIHGINPQYLQYYYIALDDIKALKPLYTGLRKVIHVSKLMQTKLPVPSDAEQNQIARYLDWKTSEIMRLIAAKKKQIKLLDEQRYTYINHSVLRGINPSVDMKDSGVAWLGFIPTDWQVYKIRQLFTERRVKVSDKDYPPLSVAKIGCVPQLDDVVSSDDHDNRKLVKAGDFVINSRSDRKGSSGISVIDGSVSLINLVLQPLDNLIPKYIHLLLRCHSFIEEFYRNGRGLVSDLWTTRYSEMRNISIPVPPKAIQQQIVAYLDKKNAAINVAIDAIKREIALIQEYKVRLISDVVTGQIDVRHITVPETELVANEVNESEDENKTEEVDDNADS